jgi:two-component system, NarL family, sensor histidine kinase BarA
MIDGGSPREALKVVEGGLGRRESVLQRKLTLGDMLEADTFTELVKNFVELYKVGIKVFDERGGKLVDIKIGNGDFCGYVFSFPEGRSRCTATVARVKDGPITTTQSARPPIFNEAPPVGLITVPCFTGLRYLVMPIRWEGDQLGRIVFGPFAPDDLHEFPLTLREISRGFEVGKAGQFLEKIRRAPESTVVKVIVHFSQLLDTLVAAGQKTYLTSQMHIEATLENNRELEARNKKLEELNNRLKELDRLKSSFLATVSHELRTPLTSIIGYSEMLAEGLAGSLNAEQVEYVRTIMEKGETLLKLISSILDISQIEAGKLRLNFESLSLGELIQTSVTSVTPQAQKKGVILDTRLPAKGPLRAWADRDKLKQVLVNLLANAVKFTSKGGTVSLYLSEAGPQPELGAEGYRIIVEDSGVGIPQEQFEKIFDTFYQVDNSSTREFGGAGLGLAIVRSFVTGHGGQVRVSSEMGRGSRFTVVMPLQPPQPRTAHTLPPTSETVPDRF